MELAVFGDHSQIVCIRREPHKLHVVIELDAGHLLIGSDRRWRSRLAEESDLRQRAETHKRKPVGGNVSLELGPRSDMVET